MKLIPRCQPGNVLQFTPEEQRYLEWSKMTPEQKREYRANRAKSHLQSGPSITNFWEAFQTYIGNRDPENPNLQTGDVPNPGMRNPKQVVGTIQKAKSIAERAARISDKIWDKHYLRLVNKGEAKRVQAVRDLHFRAKAPDTKISSESGKPIHSYHGTGKQFTEFDTTGKYSTLDNGYWGKGAYFSPNKEVGEIYAQGEKTPVVYDTYLNIKNPEIRIMDSEKWLGTPIKNGDGVIAKLPEDLVDETFDMTEFVATKPSQIKLSNAVTRDNNGKIIPISKRDNFLNNDMRYKKGGKL